MRHNEPELTPQELSRVVDGYAPATLGGVLGRDPVFRIYARRVQKGANSWAEAGTYVIKGPGRRLIAHMLEVAAAEPFPSRVRDRLITLGDQPFWSLEEPPAGAAQRWLRLEIRDKLSQGATLLARRGAGLCLANCGTRLTERRSRTIHGAYERRDYCDRCAANAVVKANLGRNKDAIREVLDRASAAVLSVPDRTRARRLKRVPQKHVH